MKRLAIISDTHGHNENLDRALELIRQRDVDAIIHCGDVCGDGIVERCIEWPAHYVQGNCDFHPEHLRQVVQAFGARFHGLFGELELEGRRIAFLHGHESRRLRETIESGAYDLVCYGHTHVQESHREGETLVLNPGALYRASVKSFAVVELPSLEIEIVELK